VVLCFHQSTQYSLVAIIIKSLGDGDLRVPQFTPSFLVQLPSPSGGIELMSFSTPKQTFKAATITSFFNKQQQIIIWQQQNLGNTFEVFFLSIFNHLQTARGAAKCAKVVLMP
jgi:hypothetical protein